MANPKRPQTIEELIPRRIKFVKEVKTVGINNKFSTTTNSAGSIRNSSYLKSIWNWKNSFQISCGFKNRNNTCYLNSILQCLLYTPAFYNFLFSKKHPDACSNPSAICFLCDLGKISFHLRTSRPIFPKSIIRHLSLLNKSFSPLSEQDAHEFFICLLDKLAKNDSSNLVNSIFGGRWVSSIKCLKCSVSSSTEESFFDLSLDISKSHSVEQAMESFFKTQYLAHPENLYFCNRCDCKVKATKSLSISSPPNILSIHLKRFSMFGSFSGSFSKNNKNMSYNGYIDISIHVQGENRSHRYLLYALVVHVGASADTGHYVSFVKGPTGQWYLIDDDRINKTSFKTVLRQSPYILFYKRSQVFVASSIGSEDGRHVSNKKKYFGKRMRGNFNN